MSSPIIHHGKLVDEIGERCMRRVGSRLIPILVISYVCAFVDKLNVGFAALTMNRDLHLSASQFGFGAGIFYRLSDF